MAPFGTTINKCLPDKYNRSKDPYDIRQQNFVTTNDVQQYTLFIIQTAFKQKQITIQCILYPPYDTPPPPHQTHTHRNIHTSGPEYEPLLYMADHLRHE